MVLGTVEDGSESATDLEVTPRVPPETPLLAASTPADEEGATLEAEEAGGSEPVAPETSLSAASTPADEEGATLEAVEATLEAEEAGGSEPVAPETPVAGMSEAMLAEYDLARPKRGDIRKGVVLSVQPTEAVIDIGAKRECVVTASDLQKLGGEAGELHVGDEVSVYVVKAEGQEPHIVGSLYLAQMEGDWARAEAMEQSGEIFEARVSGQNRGGLLVPFGRLRGFVPASHLVSTNNEAGDRPVALNHWIGKVLPFKVIEVNRRRNRLILSYRAARRQWRSQQKQSLLDELAEGAVRKGIVSSLASFGAFVDLGGADGLIHVSEMAWYRVEQPSEILHVGQEVEVYVLRVDSERGRIGLSLKRLQPDPWTLVEGKYHPGQIVEGKITKLVDFGAFAELEKGIEGLIHLTELADRAPARAEELVQPGQVCSLRVLRVDAQNRRIGLSMRGFDAGEPETREEERAADEQTGTPLTPDEAAPPANGDEMIGPA